MTWPKKNLPTYIFTHLPTYLATQQTCRLVTIETLITILTIENLNSWQSLLPDNQKWQWTAFAIIAMFFILKSFCIFWIRIFQFEKAFVWQLLTKSTCLKFVIYFHHWISRYLEYLQDFDTKCWNVDIGQNFPAPKQQWFELCIFWMAYLLFQIVYFIFMIPHSLSTLSKLGTTAE